jgi:hypothetical protein
MVASRPEHKAPNQQMVFMSDTIASSFAQQLRELEEFIAGQWAWPTPEAGFVIYVFNAAGEPCPFAEPSELTWPDRTAIKHPQTMSACGYLLACGVSATPNQQSELVSALDHLTSKDAFPLDRQSFAFRPLEVVGVILAAQHCQGVDAATLRRLDEIVRRLPIDANKDDWSAELYCLAACLLGHELEKRNRPVERYSPTALALVKWITAAFSGRFPALAEADINRVEDSLLERCATGGVENDDVGRSAALHFGLRTAVSERIRSRLAESWPATREQLDATVIVEQICRRFPLFAKQLQQRRCDWVVEGKQEKCPRPTIEMRDEYDVQDALHAILKLFFDDVRAEEWTPSYAGGQSRMDFVLKREQIVLEVKHTGTKLTQNDIARQLAVDKDYYRKHPDCKTLICCVFDPNCRCSNPVALESDVSTIDGDCRVVVIVSPKGT